MSHFGNICELHPELGGRRHNGGNCPECVKVSKAAYRARKKTEIQAAMREYRALHAEKLKAQNAEWARNNKHRVRALNLKRVGFTPELFDTAVAHQNGKCAVCETPLDSIPAKQRHADHCHNTGAPRGVLCHHCNAGLGSFRDSPDFLRSAIRYLETPTLVKCLL